MTTNKTKTQKRNFYTGKEFKENFLVFAYFRK